MTLVTKGILIAAFLIPACAQAVNISGRIKLDANRYDAGRDTAEAMVGKQTSSDLSGQFRLELQQTLSDWQFNAAWQLDARHGSSVKKDSALTALVPQLDYLNADYSYWDLDSPVTNSHATQSSQRIDRLSATWSRTDYVVRLGRQALTWGSGQVFHPMDLVNPFQPVATDTAYKRGTDMVYGQWLFEDGSDVQVAYVPHRNRNNPDPDGNKDTSALYANLVGGELQWNLLLAQDYADTVAGVNVSGPLAGTVWNLAVVPTRLESGTTYTSALANVTLATTFLNRNLNSFAEFYHNGFGESGRDYSLTDLNANLLLRLQRGQLFVTGRDYLSLGATWDMTPLLQLIPTLIYNLHDHSRLFDTQVSYSLSNNVSIKAGLRLAFGEQGSEFGGLQYDTGFPLYLAQSNQGFIRLEAYF